MTDGKDGSGHDLADRLRQVETDLAQLQVAYDARSSRIVEERTRLVAQLEEEHELRAGFRRAIDESQQQAALAEFKAEDLRHSVMNRDDQIAALQEHVAALDEQIAACDGRIADIEAHRDELQRNLDAVMNSRSMRLLAPVRAAYGRLRSRDRS